MRFRSHGKRCCNHHAHKQCHYYGSLFERFLRTPYIKEKSKKKKKKENPTENTITSITAEQEKEKSEK